MPNLFDAYVQASPKPLLMLEGEGSFSVGAAGSQPIEIMDARILGDCADSFVLSKRPTGRIESGDVATFSVSAKTKGQALLVVTVQIPHPEYNPMNETCWLLSW